MADKIVISTIFKAVDKMSAPIRKIQNRFGGFTRKATKSMRAVNRSINKVIRSLGSLARKMLTVGTGVVLGAIAAATLAFKNMADEGDRLAKTARLIDFDIEELQRLEFIAGQSGVTMGTLTSSLGAFTKRLGEARVGSGALATILKKSNPALLQQLTAAEGNAEAFSMMLEAIGQLPNANDKAALAAAAFSRAGMSLINITNIGSDALARMNKEFIENGFITQEQAENIEEFNDAMDTFKRSIMGLIRDTLAPLFPILKDLVLEWREWIIANKELIRGNVTKFIKGVVSRVRQLGSIIKTFVEDNNLGQHFQDLVNFGSRVVEFFATYGSQIQKVGLFVLAFVVALKALSAAMIIANLVMLANPIGLIIVAITAVILAIAALVIWWDEVVNAFVNGGGLMADAILVMLGPIGWAILAVRKLAQHWDSIRSFFGFESDDIIEAADAAERAANAQNGGGAGFPGVPGAGTVLASPQDQITRTLSENNSTTNNTLDIRMPEGLQGILAGGKSPFSMPFTGGFVAQ